jgi:hypothetical protein
VDQTSAGAGWTFWKATDETLARFVTVLMFASDFPRIAEAITAARAASRLSDPRFSQVFDVEDGDDELAYVVLEWVAAESLLDMLADGPLDSPQAVSLVYEAAVAIAAAHATGLTHLRLSPRCLHWTRGGGVKITGLGIDAVLTGPELTGPRAADLHMAGPDGTELTATGPDAAGLHVTDLDGAGAADGGRLHVDGSADLSSDSADLTDTRGLAQLLYAALTGYWPGPPASAGTGETGADDAAASDTAGRTGPTGLPPAPEADGLLSTPRQVSATVPANIDALTCQALFQRPSRHGPAPSTPAMLAEALADVAPPAPLLVPAAPTTSFRTPASNEYRPAGPPSAAPSRSAAYHRPGGKHLTGTTAIVAVVIVLVLVAAGAAGWAFSHNNDHPAAAPTSSGPSSSSRAAASSVVLAPVGATSFDVLGDDGGNEDASQAKNVMDSNASTFWHTDYYLGYPAFGNLKKGSGLILDMGKQVRLSQVVVQFGTSCCTDAQIEIGNNNDPVPSALNSFTSVASSTTAQGVTTFSANSAATGRYVLIWITRLAPLAGAANEYQAQIYNVVVHGAAVSQSG